VTSAARHEELAFVERAALADGERVGFRSLGARVGDRMIFGGVLALVLLAPWLYGSDHAGALLLLGGVTLAGAAPGGTTGRSGPQVQTEQAEHREADEAVEAEEHDDQVAEQEDHATVEQEQEHEQEGTVQEGAED